jgi:hypothetical protein
MSDDSAHSGPPEDTAYGEDALKGADIKSGDEAGTPVHAPTVPDDEGNPGDGTGEGVAADANNTTNTNPQAPEQDHV